MEKRKGGKGSGGKERWKEMGDKEGAWPPFYFPHFFLLRTDLLLLQLVKERKMDVPGPGQLYSHLPSVCLSTSAQKTEGKERGTKGRRERRRGKERQSK
jgi:hypothetical protein